MKLSLLVPVGSFAMALAAPGPSPPAPVTAPALLRPPVAGAVVTQPFGCTALELEPVAPQCPQGHFHAGIDYAAPFGATVVAAAGGVATWGFDPGGYGLHVVIAHGGGLTTLYGHLSATAITPGTPVAGGAPVGAAGSSGLSTGPHLHFEVLRQGRPVDPNPFITGGT